MTDKLSPERVTQRLAELAALYVPEDVESARLRFARERPSRAETFEQAVARRLGELRALIELTKVLHAAGRELAE
jgi:hypothetical protein